MTCCNRWTKTIVRLPFPMENIAKLAHSFAATIFNENKMSHTERNEDVQAVDVVVGGKTNAENRRKRNIVVVVCAEEQAVFGS